MAKGVNFTFHGRLGKDPELKYVGAKQTPCTNFRVAVNMGEAQGTEWIDCVAWGEVALGVAEQFKKGDKIWIKDSGPKTNRWEYQGKSYEKMQFVIWSFAGEESAEGEAGEAAGGAPDQGDQEIPF